MANHWSREVFVLCWNDPHSNGRQRMSWGDREYLERLAASMQSGYDPVMYDGFGAKVQIRESDAPLEKLKLRTPKKRKPKKRKPKAEPVAA